MSVDFQSRKYLPKHDDDDKQTKGPSCVFKIKVYSSLASGVKQQREVQRSHENLDMLR